MRNSFVVIFGLASVLFVAESDSAAARFVHERARRATDGISELAAALFGEGLESDSLIGSGGSLPQSRFFKRSSPFLFRRSQPEIDITGLATSLKQLQMQLAQITNQVASSLLTYGPAAPSLSPKRSNGPDKAQVERIAGMAYKTVMALAKQLQTLQGTVIGPDGSPITDIVFGGKPTTFRHSVAPVSLPIPVPGESGYPAPGEITLPIKPVTLPFNPATLPFDPATVPFEPPTLPFDTEVPNPSHPKPVSSGKPNSDSPTTSLNEHSNKPYSAEETPDASEEETDKFDNEQQKTKVVYESGMDDNPYNIIPAVLHLRMRKQ